MQTAVQQIMIGSKCHTYDEALSTLEAIKAAGYTGIELNDFMIEKSSILVRALTKFSGMSIGRGGRLDWHKLIAESGLEVISLHSNLGALEKDPNKIVQKARDYGTDKIVITGMYRFNYSDLGEVTGLANRLNTAGKALIDEGISLLYHNHNCELQRVSPGKTAYQVLIDNTNPEYVNFEFDSYWLAEAGANVDEMMKSLGSRIKLWHINDRGCRKSGPYMTPILKQHSMELGLGNMDLETYYQLAVQGGVEAIVLESHKDWIEGDPIKSLQVSAEFLKQYDFISDN